MRIYPLRRHNNERDHLQVFMFWPGPRRGGPGRNCAWGVCIRIRLGELWRHVNITFHERQHARRPGGKGTIRYEISTWQTDKKMKRYKTMKRYVRLKIGLGGIDERRAGINYDNRDSHYWRKYRPGKRAA